MVSTSDNLVLEAAMIGLESPSTTITAMSCCYGVPFGAVFGLSTAAMTSLCRGTVFQQMPSILWGVFGGLVAPMVFGLSWLLICPDPKSSYGEEVRRYAGTFAYTKNAPKEENTSMQRLIRLRNMYETGVLVAGLLGPIAGGVVSGMTSPKKQASR